MLAFACPVCERLVSFENTACLHCGAELGFDWSRRTMGTVGASGSEPGRRCANAQLAACNWLVDSDGELCASCLLTRTRPNDADADGLAAFAAAEGAKRRLLFELADLGLPIAGRTRQSAQECSGLAFDLLSSESEPVSTGHADGVITLDLAEVDPAHREQMRVRFREPYRTVLGHFRHEIGHYYQSILIAPGSPAELRCRELFGDEREDYQQAIDRYYRDGAPAGWEQRFVSAYATMHPWEDWAETFAHYLHIHDTVQTAAAYGIRVDGPSIPTRDTAPLRSRPERADGDIYTVLDAWIPLTYALNATSRSMGEPDVYPFILTPEIEAKLALIDGLVRGSAQPRAARIVEVAGKPGASRSGASKPARRSTRR